MLDIYKFLESNRITYRRFDHPAVHTCEEAKELCPAMPGRTIKNLFLCDRNKERYFLVVIPYEKSVDLKALKDLLNVSKLSFAPADNLQKYLGVDPGSVTILGLVNDTDNKVEAYFDNDIWDQDLQVHPLVNTASLVITNLDIIKFLEITKHEYKVIKVPNRVLQSNS